MDVFIDSALENFVPELVLHAEAVLDDRWNGWLRPLAIAAAMQNFLEAWKLNDPNGTWGEVEEAGGVLVCVADGEIADEFPMAGMTGTGELLYDLTGWVWAPWDQG